MTSDSLGALQKGWSRVRFGDVVKQSGEKTDPEADGIERYVAGEHMESDDLRIRRWGTVGDGYLGPAFHKRFRPGQVLYGSRRTYLRKVAVADFDGVCANTTFVLVSVSGQLLQDFLPHVMSTESFHAYSIGKSRGSTNPYVNFSDLVDYEFALPPLEEQKRIVEVLTASDAATTVQQQLSRSAGELSTSLVAELSADEGTRHFSLCEVAQLYRGATPSTKQRAFWDGDINWFTPSDLTAGSSRRISTSRRQIAQVGLDSCSARLVPAGSLLLSTRATIGYPKIAATQCSFNQGVTAIVCGPLLTAEYLQAVLDGMSSELRALGAGSTFPEIPKTRLEQMRVPVPRLDDQRRLVTQLESLTRVQEATATSIRRLRELGKSLIESHGGMSSV